MKSESGERQRATVIVDFFIMVIWGMQACCVAVAAMSVYIGIALASLLLVTAVACMALALAAGVVAFI